MKYNFDQHVERRGSDSVKWLMHGDEVLPMWVADMDFVAPEPILGMLRDRVDHGVFGYTRAMPQLREVICARLKRLYDWQVSPDEILFFPGLVSTLNVACRAIGDDGDGVVMQPPVYFPFLTAAKNQGRVQQFAPLTASIEGQIISYEVDHEALEAAITPRTNLFLLSNPHNPTGQMYGIEDLERMAEVCLRHDLVICSDEIHCELLLDGSRHQPVAALSPEIAERCITLMAPSKTFNLAGLSCGFAIVQNPHLRQRVEAAAAGIVPGVNIMGYVGALAAFQYADDWLCDMLSYVATNRDFLVEFVAEQLPGIRTTRPEATYLAWLDCSLLGIDGSPHEFFLNVAKVALNQGDLFGPGGDEFVRLNFACPRTTLQQALERMRAAVSGLG